MDTKTVSNTVQLGDVASNLVNGFSLFFQVVVFKELCQMRIIVGAGQGMDLQQCLDNRLDNSWE